MKLTTLLVLAMFICLNLNAAIRYVTQNGTGTQNGSSWANAYPGSSLQNAIDLSGNGDEVWVAAGTYKTTATTNRLDAFHMKNDVKIYGSFQGTEQQLSDRDLSAGITSILSGEIGVAGISDNSYHVISNTALISTAELNGFVISDANDDRGATINEGLGGGVYNDGSGPGNFCSPTFTNCIIINNQAVFGAGMFNSGYDGGNSSPMLLNCVIASNTATSGGGGIDNFGLLNGNASPTLLNCIIYGNTAAYRAGGMYNWGGNNGNASPVITNCIITENTAVDGGGIVADNLNSTTGSSGTSMPVFRNTIMRDNTITGFGPQFFILGSAEVHANYSDIDLTNQTFPHTLSGTQTSNIDVDPIYMNSVLPAGNDGLWITNDDGLQLQENSSCINSGSNVSIPATDILGVSRSVSGEPDMGAYEFDPSVSVNEDVQNSNLSLFPNPATEKIVISGMNTQFSYSIRSINGTVVQKGESVLENQSITISEIPVGIYIVVLENENGTFTKRFVKIK